MLSHSNMCSIRPVSFSLEQALCLHGLPMGGLVFSHGSKPIGDTAFSIKL